MIIIALAEISPPPTPQEPSSITVAKEVVCESDDGDPRDDIVCAFAQASNNFPESGDYPITVIYF